MPLDNFGTTLCRMFVLSMRGLRSRESDSRFGAAFILFSEAGPFRIFAECTASPERIANRGGLHVLKS